MEATSIGNFMEKRGVFSVEKMVHDFSAKGGVFRTQPPWCLFQKETSMCRIFGRYAPMIVIHSLNFVVFIRCSLPANATEQKTKLCPGRFSGLRLMAESPDVDHLKPT